MSYRHVAAPILALLVACAAVSVNASEQSPPPSWSSAGTATKTAIPTLELPAVDRAMLLQQDAHAHAEQIRLQGAASKRMRVATGNTVDVSPATHGRLQRLDDGSQLWQLTVRAEYATDLRFGFERFALPDSVTIHVVNPMDHEYRGPYSSADRNQFGALWIGPVAGAALTLEMHVPAGVPLPVDAVHLSEVSTGYRDVLGRNGGLIGLNASGSCNIDTACPLGDDYRDEIRAVAKYFFQSGGTYMCTGSLVNNTSNDLTPYFLTAEHCVSTVQEAASMQLFWNYQSRHCGDHGGVNQNDNEQSGGGTLVARHRATDTALVRLNSTPPDEYNVHYAGWDASNITPSGSIGVHHPSGWVKAITEDANGISTMNNCIASGSSTHWRTGAPYTQGTTEGGSSGSMIMVPAGDGSGHEKLVIGVLSGGNAGCSGSLPNSGFDCYGKLALAWDSGSSASTRLKDWLDPVNSGVVTHPGTDADVDGDPQISISPSNLTASVEAGTWVSEPLTISNVADGVLSWDILEAPADCSSSADVGWLSLAPTSGASGAGGSRLVDVTLNALTLDAGHHRATLCINSNDANTPQLGVTVTLTVTPAPPTDGIFCHGFESGQDGSCVGGDNPDIVASGPINHAIQADIDGTSVDWISGQIHDADIPGTHFNPYHNGDQLTFWWNTGADGIAGVASNVGSSDFLVLASGAVVGPAATWSTTNNPGPAAWAAGATGHLGFRFNCATLPTAPPNGICYGYVHLSTTAPDGFPATILDYAYDRSGAEITVP